MSRRNKKVSTTPDKTSTRFNKRVENSWVLLMKGELFENNNFLIITLPHPGSGKPAKYCLDDSHNKIYEIVSFSEPNRSWFIGQTVKSDGSMMMATVVNPIFLVLPRLREQCGTRAIPLEDLLSEKGFDKILDFIPSLESIADLKGSPDMKAYKYNEEKTLAWLESRVRAVAQVLKHKNIHVTSGAVSATFVSSNISNENIDEEFYLKYAHGLISEYLQEDLAELLEKKFDFKANLIESIGKKRKSEAGDNNANKKQKPSLDSSFKENSFDSPNPVTEIKKPKPLTAKEKARQKAASGTKTLSAFFTKK